MTIDNAMKAVDVIALCLTFYIVWLAMKGRFWTNKEKSNETEDR